MTEHSTGCGSTKYNFDVWRSTVKVVVAQKITARQCWPSLMAQKISARQCWPFLMYDGLWNSIEWKARWKSCKPVLASKICNANFSTRQKLLKPTPVLSNFEPGPNFEMGHRSKFWNRSSPCLIIHKKVITNRIHMITHNKDTFTIKLFR